MDEDTQLALALSLSAAEAEATRHYGTNYTNSAQPQQQHPISGSHHSRDTHVRSDEEFARKLQQEMDNEAIQHRNSQLPPSSAHSTGSAQPIHPLSLCEGCRLPLGFGRHIIINQNKQYHPSCFKCSNCRAPFQPSQQYLMTDEGLAMCQRCHKELLHPRCCVCSDFLPSVGNPHRIIWNTNPFWNEKFCPVHTDDGTKRCTWCQRMQPRSQLHDWIALDDGPLLCLQCLGSIVPDTQNAMPLYNDVLAFFNSLGVPLPVVPPLSLVDDSTLNSNSRHTDGPVFHTRGITLAEYSQQVYTTTSWHPLSHTTSNTNVFSSLGLAFGRKSSGLSSSSASEQQHVVVHKGPKECRVTAILVLKGMPRLLTGSVLAHETMHAWLRLNGGGYDDLPLEIEEGLCQLMALLWLEAQKESQGQGDAFEQRLAAFLGNSIRTDRSLVYGDGFRAVLDAFQKHGLATVLAHVRRAKLLPS